MDNSKSAAFDLSQEELLLILSEIDAKGMLGLDKEPFDALSEELRQQLMQAAMRALRARGIIVPGEDGTLILDMAVRTTVHVAAFAAFSLSAVVRYRNPNRLHSYIAHRADNLWVEHTQPDAGIHSFRLAVEPLPIQDTLERLLAIEEQAAPPAEAFVIEQQQLDHIQQAARNDDRETVQDTLRRFSADEATVRQFTDLLIEPGDTAVVQVIDRRVENEELYTQTVTVVQTSAGFWLMQSEGPVHLRCTPASAGAVRQTLSELIDMMQLDHAT
jgi:hypothetical protein